MMIDLRAIRDAAGYTPLFCEENVFRFLQYLREWAAPAHADATPAPSDSDPVHADADPVPADAAPTPADSDPTPAGDAPGDTRKAWGLFISNPGRSVAMGCQKTDPDGIIVWDYHVVALVESDARDGRDRILVCDSDSVLPFPCPLAMYLRRSFPVRIPSRLSPEFRLVEAQAYLASLVSDRSHMLDAAGNWLAPPPRWPAPGEGSGKSPNLMEFIDMRKPCPGRVLGLEEMTDPRTCT